METHATRRAAVFGATGATGREIVRELLDRGVPVRAVSRSADKLARDFGELDVERHPADLGDPDAALAAAAGCDLIFHCVGLPPGQFPRHVTLARHTAAAMREHAARGVLVTSYWSYGPGDDDAMSEDRPLQPGSEMARIRKEQEDVLLEAGGCVARLPDFYGPGSDISLMNDALEALATGAAVIWPGSPEAPRDFVFVPDTGRLICDLAERSRAYGQRWNLPGSGALPPRTILETAARLRDAGLKIRRGRRWMLILAGLFNRQARGFKDVLPLYERPAILDTSRYRELVGGEPRVTPYEEGLRQTFAWLDQRRATARH